jgi:hypothetical protein
LVELSIEPQTSIERPAADVPPSSAETTTLRPRPIRRSLRASGARLSANADLHVAAQSSDEQTATGATKTLDLMPRASSFAAGDSEPVERRTNDDAHTTAEQVLNTSLFASANHPAYREQRAPPKLMHAADGGYDYSARARAGTVLLFRAHIAPDGTVRFADGANLQLAPIPISGSFELDDLLRRGEKHTAEKRWFLEQTAALRERLAVEMLRTTRMQVGHHRH